ncbi:hypothetical protein [Psychrobacillus sp. L4]|uniref:hypothetical protein n=1 Tax=Psychrobacillus sp. L4 TaxID=3236892 RepID=UPI0036F28225
MLRDISHWEMIGYGGKSTLDKEELLELSTRERYLIKYPRQFELGISWEDITELIAADIGRLLQLKMMDVEIVTRKNRRGSLLKNIIPVGVMNEEGGVLLSDVEDYDTLLETNLKGIDLIDFGFSCIKQLDFWVEIREQFIEMNFFDVLIGNQDRHPFNWMILFHNDGRREFSTIYDNGASLGFRFDDIQLMDYISKENKVVKYIRSAKVKAGLFERKSVKAIDLIKYMKHQFPNETQGIAIKIEQFDMQRFHEILEQNSILTTTQKEWLKLIISLRQQSILKWYREGE